MTALNEAERKKNEIGVDALRLSHSNQEITKSQPRRRRVPALRVQTKLEGTEKFKKE